MIRLYGTMSAVNSLAIPHDKGIFLTIRDMKGHSDNLVLYYAINTKRKIATPI